MRRRVRNEPLQQTADSDRAAEAVRHGLFYASGAPLPFTPAAETGQSVALIGPGPEALACAAGRAAAASEPPSSTRVLYQGAGIPTESPNTNCRWSKVSVKSKCSLSSVWSFTSIP